MPDGVCVTDMSATNCSMSGLLVHDIKKIIYLEIPVEPSQVGEATTRISDSD
jgi:hypothetical protein